MHKTLNQLNRHPMQKLQEYKEWLNKKEILEIYPIGITTYKRRIKKLNNPQYQRFTRMVSKKIENSNLKEIRVREIHKSVLEELFSSSRIPNSSDYEKVIRWVNHHRWEWFCDVIPSHCYPRDLKNKMHHFFNNLKKKLKGKHRVILFYSIEKTEKDGYYHSHFLIDSNKSGISKKEIKELINDICEENTRTETRQFIEPYDYSRFGITGSNYTLKNLKYEYGCDILR